MSVSTTTKKRARSSKATAKRQNEVVQKLTSEEVVLWESR